LSWSATSYEIIFIYQLLFLLSFGTKQFVKGVCYGQADVEILNLFAVFENIKKQLPLIRFIIRVLYLDAR
jgi:hypothetical protein